MSFGPYPALTIADARKKHQAAWLDVKSGIDPQARYQVEKIKAAGGDAFGAVADKWLLTRTGKAGKTSARDQRSVRYLKDGYRKAKGFGSVPIDQVRLRHLMPLLEAFNKPTRIRVQSTARKIVSYAKARSLIEQSPFSDIDPDVFAPHREKPRPAITNSIKFGGLMRKIAFYEGRGDNLTGYALELLALTFVRPGTVQTAEWKHFDIKRALWVIPFEQLKMRTQREQDETSSDDFVVPLSRQALALLRELHQITGESEYLFPGGKSGRTISENTLNSALHALGYREIHCAHGFRSTASTILNKERTKQGRRRFEPSLIEFQLDHQDQSTRAIYDRDDCLPERVALMQFWADKVDELRDDDKAETKLHAVM